MALSFALIGPGFKRRCGRPLHRHLVYFECLNLNVPVCIKKKKSCCAETYRFFCLAGKCLCGREVPGSKWNILLPGTSSGQ